MACEICGDTKYDGACPDCFIGYCIEGPSYVGQKFLGYEGFNRYDGQLDRK